MKFEVFCQHSAIADRLEFYILVDHYLEKTGK